MYDSFRLGVGLQRYSDQLPCGQAQMATITTKENSTSYYYYYYRHCLALRDWLTTKQCCYTNSETELHTAN